jgi:hypothetical protein
VKARCPHGTLWYRECIDCDREEFEDYATVPVLPDLPWASEFPIGYPVADVQNFTAPDPDDDILPGLIRRGTISFHADFSPRSMSLTQMLEDNGVRFEFDAPQDGMLTGVMFGDHTLSLEVHLHVTVGDRVNVWIEDGQLKAIAFRP